MSSSQLYHYLVSGSAPFLFPTDTMFAIMHYGRDAALEIPKCYPYSSEWGKAANTHLTEREDYPLPGMIDILWLSIVERRFYSLVGKMPTAEFEQLFGEKEEESGEAVFEQIVLGMAPYGGVALWANGFKKSELVAWMYAEETKVGMNEFSPSNPSLKLDDLCDYYINNDPIVKQNLETNGLPPRDLFDNYMKQFTYRYLPMFGHWDEDEKKWTKYAEDETAPEFDYIEEALYDGTHDKLHDDKLLNYHEAGKPKKLAVKWHIKKSEYTAYFWLDDHAIRAVFDKFYGIHPDTKTDFIIHIDPEKNKYQLALFRYGMTEPKTLAEETSQTIVFKNKFEHFRSKNYNQPRGAWIW